MSSAPKTGFTEEESAGSTLKTTLVSEVMDAETGQAVVDENGKAMMAAVPQKAQRAAVVEAESEGTSLELAAVAPESVDNTSQDVISEATDTDQAVESDKLAEAEGVAENVEVVTPADTDAELATETEVAAFAAETETAPKKNFFQRLFSERPKSGAAKRTGPRIDRGERGARMVRTDRGERRRAGIVVASAAPKTIITSTSQPTVASLANANSEAIALPGVKSSAKLFGIDTSETEEADGSFELAALGSLTRISPKGLRLQHDKVDVGCLKPEILRIIKTVERRYGKKPIITSGYRSPKRNRKAGGARNSTHIFCKAVDIQVEGISKWDLAKYLRTIPGRGGVGTYCRTRSVHVDTGSKRDWHHPCRRSSIKKV